MRSARNTDRTAQRRTRTLFRRILAVMAVVAGGVLIAVGMVAAQSTDPSATREFDTRSVAAGGGPVVATITVSGATQAVVTESLPTGFTYVESSLPDNQVRPDPNDVSAQQVRPGGQRRQPVHLHGDGLTDGQHLRQAHGGPGRLRRDRPRQRDRPGEHRRTRVR